MKTQDPKKTALMFEFYVKKIWPMQRKFAQKHLAKRCLRCVASEKMIPLNAQQICEVCALPTLNPPQSATSHADLVREMNERIHQSIARPATEYDILIMFSGGKDSCYMVQRLRNEHPNVRILTCSIDNHFMSPVAKENIATALEKLNVDHIFVKPKLSFYLSLFRYTITHLNPDGCYGTVDFSDGEFMLDTGKKIAQDKGIPLVACGYSKYQVQDGLKLSSYWAPIERERPARVQVAGIALKDIFQPEDQSLWWNRKNSENSFQPQLFFPLFAWNLEEEQIKRQVIDWGLMSAKYQSPIVTNHQLIPLLGVVDVHKLGYSSFEPEFCRMIREGKAERLHWLHTFEFLEYTAKTGFLVKPVITDLLKRLSLSEKDVGIVYHS